MLNLVAAGCTSREIGNRLGIVAATVDCEVNGAMTKLTARTRTQAAFLAAAPSAPDGPLFVLEEPSAEVVDELVRELANAGWDVRPDWEILDSTNGIAPPRTVWVRTVRSTEDALSALAAAVSGAGLIVTARGAMLERLIEDLQDLCARRELRLSYEERRLLKFLAAGTSVSEAARKLYISRRTAERRLRAARLALGVRTTTEAVVAVGHSQRERLLQIVRAS